MENVFIFALIGLAIFIAFKILKGALKLGVSIAIAVVIVAYVLPLL